MLSLWQRLMGGAVLVLSVGASLHAAPKLILSETRLQPGEALRVELDGVILNPQTRLILLKNRYPLFPIGPDAWRAIAGIPLGTRPGRFPLVIRSSGREIARADV